MLKFNKFAIIPALATMYDKDENFDEKAQRRLIRKLLEKGIDGFYIGGATGEGFLMSPEERKRVISVSLDEIGGKVPAIVYSGSNDTKTAVELTRFAEKEGADAFSSVRPYYGAFSQAQIRQYYKTLSECVNIPLIIYNNSSAQMNGIDEMKDICDLPNCGGIKYTLMNHYEMKLAKKFTGKLVFSGADEMFASAMIAGVDGAIGSTYNFAADLFIRLRENFENGNFGEVQLLNEIDARFIDIMFKNSFMGSMKAIFEMMGIGKRISRSPDLTLDEAQTANLKSDLKALREEYNLSGIEFLDIMG